MHAFMIVCVSTLSRTAKKGDGQSKTSSEVFGCCCLVVAEGQKAGITGLTCGSDLLCIRMHMKLRDVRENIFALWSSSSANLFNLNFCKHFTQELEHITKR